MPNKKALNILLIAATLLLLWVFRGSVISTLSWFGDMDAIVESLQGIGWWGLAMVVMLILIQLFIAFIPGQVLVVASGYLYGAPLTILFVSLSGILGSQLVFALARKYGNPFVYKFASQKTIERWDKIAGKRGMLFYLFMFVLPFVPSDMMCYVAGFGKISPKRFFIANFIGRLLSTTETALLGAYGLHPPAWLWILFAISLAGLYAGWLIYNKVSTSTVDKT